MEVGSIGGAGRGFDPVEFAAFDVPIEESRERFYEAVEVVLAAWTNERLDFSGRYWNFHDVELMPKPLQQPHPPTWIAASSEPPALWAAQRGLFIMMSPHASFAENAELLELYRQELENNSYSLEGRDIPNARMIAVAGTNAQAAKTARSGVEWVAAAYINKDKSAEASGTSAMTMERSGVMDHYMNPAVIHGCPESVIDQLERLHQEMHLDLLMCTPLSHSSFIAFTESILPHFQ